jgi:hypothetical protein
MAGVTWGAHSDMILSLYRGLIRSVLKYGCIAFDQMATTHMLKLERIQYRCLRVALGLMKSTHVQTLEVIGGVPPLRLRFSMLDHKYLISTFSTGEHPLRQLLAVLSRLNSIQKWFGSLTCLGITIWNQSAQFTITRLRCYYTCPMSTIRWSGNWLLLERTFTKVVVSRLVASETSEFDASSIFLTDCSKGGWVPVLVYIILEVPSPAFVLGSQVEWTKSPDRYLVVTDSMRFLKALQTRRVAPRTHSLVFEIKEACWWLTNNEYKIHIMSIPSHVRVRGKERADQLAGDAVENGIEMACTCSSF